MLFNIPNSLTMLRVVLIPVFVVLFYVEQHWSYLASAAVFTLAAITDWLDGYLARRLGQSTPFGAFLDPVADKLMVVVALVMLVERFEHWWFTLPAMIIVAREVLVSALREWMAELGKRTNVAVSSVGKIKTVLQMVAIIGLLLDSPVSSTYWFYACMGMFYSAALLTMWSMIKYLQAAWPDMRGDH